MEGVIIMIDLPTTVSILGQNYLIKETTEKETPAIKGLWGFCDPSIHCIFIDRTDDTCRQHTPFR